MIWTTAFSLPVLLGDVVTNELSSIVLCHVPLALFCACSCKVVIIRIPHLSCFANLHDGHVLT